MGVYLICYTESGHAPAVIGRFKNFSGKKGQIYAKITENWKIFVVLIFEGDIV